MINRINYEEFFLLYVDNELSATEKKAVEHFVEINPDLKEELEILLQCRINPFGIPEFPGKEALLAPAADLGAGEPVMDDPGGYTSNLLSYIDGELDEASTKSLLLFLEAHPEKARELAMFQRTVSSPDTTVVFPDKTILYKNIQRRVLPIGWLGRAGRLAAAAAITGIALLIALYALKSGSSTSNANVTAAGGGVAPNLPINRLTGRDSMPAERATAPQPQRPVVAEPIVVRNTKEKNAGTAVTRKAVDTSNDGRPEEKEVKDPEESLAGAAADPVKKPVEPELANPRSDGSPAIAVSQAIKAPGALPLVRGTGTGSSDLASNSTIAREVSLEEPGSDRKNKLRGIFRKVARTLNKKAGPDDEQNNVVIGGFQIALQ